MKLNLWMPSLILLVGTSSCHTTQDASRTSSADDALLLEVSAPERGRIADARTAADHAKDAAAAAQAACSKAEQSRRLTGVSHKAAVAKVSASELALRHANESGTTDDVESAKQGLLTAKAECDESDATVVLRDKQSVHSSALATLAMEHVKVAEASLALTKAKAVNTLDRPDSQKADVSGFESSLRRAEGEEELARTRAETAEREVDVAAARLKKMESANTER